jgi:hypothetical protein
MNWVIGWLVKGVYWVVGWRDEGHENNGGGEDGEGRGESGVLGRESGVSGRESGVSGRESGVSGRESGVSGREREVFEERFRVTGTRLQVFSYIAMGEPPSDFNRFAEEVNERIGRLRGRGYYVHNVGFRYISEENKVRHISIPTEEIDRRGLQEGIQRLNEESREIYSGSEEVQRMLGDSTLAYTYFDVIVRKIEGSGGGHMNKTFYTVKNLGREGECLISCVRYFAGGRKYLAKTAKKMTGLDKEVFTLEDVPKLERLYQTEVVIVQDDKEFVYTLNSSGDPIIMKNEAVVLYGNKSCPNRILYDEGHFSVITGEKSLSDMIMVSKQANEDVHQARGDKKHFYFFDFETVFDRYTGGMVPYACSVVKTDERGEIEDEKLFFDSPSDKVGVQFHNYMLGEAPGIGLRYLVGFNNSRFDNFLVLKYFPEASKVFLTNNSILKMSLFGMKTFDLCRLLNTSLANAAESFKCRFRKTRVDHVKVQSEYMLGRFDRLDADKMKEYVRNDVLTLKELFFKCRQVFKDTCDEEIEEHTTIASLSYKLFKKNNKKTQYTLPILNYEDDSFVRKATIGGRSQIFRKAHEVENELACVDVVSLYPFIMANRSFPYGESKVTTRYKRNKIGVYQVTIHKQPECKIIPKREDDGSLNWEYSGEIKCVLSSVDIECLKRNRARITVHEGIYWEKQSNGIFAHIEQMKQVKLQQDGYKKSGDSRYNPALRECTKLFLNSLSGKLIQRVYKKQRSLINRERDLDNFLKQTNNQVFHLTDGGLIVGEGEKKKLTPTMPSIYGILIYSYSRSFMYDFIIKRSQTKLAMDTDSLIFYFTEVEKGIISKRLFGDDFGKLKEEIKSEVGEGERGPYGIFVNKKCYSIYKYDKNNHLVVIKARFKGISKHDKLLGDPTMLVGKNLQQVSDIYNSLEPALGFNTYQKLINDETVHFLCSKILHSTLRLNIRQNFCTKTLAPRQPLRESFNI